MNVNWCIGFRRRWYCVGLRLYMTRIKYSSGVYSLEMILSKHALPSHLEMPYFDGDGTKCSRFSGNREIHNEIPKADDRFFHLVLIHCVRGRLLFVLYFLFLSSLHQAMNRPRYKTWCKHVSENIWSSNRKSISTPFKLILIDIMAFPAVPGHIKRAPNGKIQSYLEGVFNPTTDRGEITLQIMSQLTIREFNNMRCASSTMNSALTVPNVMGRDYRRVLQDLCEEGCLSPRHDCQGCMAGNPPKMTRFCQDCRNAYMRRYLNDALRGAIDNGNWEPAQTHARGELCSQCIDKAEVKYPDGIDLCRCVENELRAVLCLDCMRIRIWTICGEQHQRSPWPGWPEADGGYYDSRDYDGPETPPEFEPPPPMGCLQCGKNVFFANCQRPRTRICERCRQLIVRKPTQRDVRRTREPASPRRRRRRQYLAVQETRKIRRSSRINPKLTEKTGECLDILPYSGCVGKAQAEKQRKNGFPLKKRPFPRGKHVSREEN